MAKKARTIRVFIASPGDLAVERRAFKDVLDDLNTGFGGGAKVKIEPFGLEDRLASTDGRGSDQTTRFRFIDEFSEALRIQFERK